MLLDSEAPAPTAYTIPDNLANPRLPRPGDRSAQLREQYPDVKLLWAGDWSTFSDPNFWVTVAGITFDDSSSALAWCSSQSLDRDHCTATRL